MKRTDSQRGMALVTVLWTMVLLSTAAMAASTMFRGYVGIMAIDKDRAQADALLTAGLETAAGLMLRLDDTPLNDVESTMSLSTGDVRIRLDDEGGLIDINKAPAELLAGLFRSIGVEDADAVAQNIVAARGNGDDKPKQAASSSPDQNTAPAPAAKPDAAKTGDDDNRPFNDVRELANVPDMLPEWINTITPMTTVYGSETINPLTAPPDVIAALPGFDKGGLQPFLDLRRRAPDDAKQLVAALGPAQKFAADKPRVAVSVRLDARMSDGYRAKVKAVIVAIEGDSQPYRVLAWNPIAPDAADGAMAER
jgi:general secretion pathway protein K